MTVATLASAKSTLEELKALDAAGTPAPWYVDSGHELLEYFHHIPDVLRTPYGDNVLSFDGDKANADLVAKARNFVPVLTETLSDILVLTGVLSDNLLARQIETIIANRLANQKDN